ncbi:hypothetical protein AB4084_23835, partial [Lysobacter sp. 2RAB21]
MRADGGPEFLCVLLGYGGGVHEIGLDERARWSADRSRKPWCTKTRSRQMACSAFGINIPERSSHVYQGG